MGPAWVATGGAQTRSQVLHTAGALSTGPRMNSATLEPSCPLRPEYMLNKAKFLLTPAGVLVSACGCACIEVHRRLHECAMPISGPDAMPPSDMLLSVSHWDAMDSDKNRTGVTAAPTGRRKRCCAGCWHVLHTSYRCCSPCLAACHSISLDLAPSHGLTPACNSPLLTSQ